MTHESVSNNHQGQRLLLWLIRKIAPGLFIGGIIGSAIALLAIHNTPLLRTFSLIASVLFGLLSALYFYGSSSSTNGGGYQWSIIERLGIAASGLGALTLALKLGLPDIFLGSHFTYLVGAMILAFIVRPVLDNISYNRENINKPNETKSSG